MFEIRCFLCFNLTTIVCDFEQTFINAVNEQVHFSLASPLSLKFCFFIALFEQLPNTLMTGCWFHFCQSCYGILQKLGLMNFYDDHLDSRQLLRSFMALALLSIDRIYRGFELFKRRIIVSDHRQQLETFVSYFENEWMHNFHPSQWSVSRKNGVQTILLKAND